MGSTFCQKITIRDIINEIDCLESLSEEMLNKKIIQISDSNNAKEFSLCDYVKGPLPKRTPGLVLLVREKLKDYDCIVVCSPQISICNVINYIDSKIGFVAHKSDVHDSVIIGRNVTIEDNVIIGENTVVEHNVVIHSGSIVGKNCLIRSHASIGSDGFNYISINENLRVKQKHLGGVKIGDNVEVGSSTCIVRGLIDPTIIGNNVKIDNLVHIAHDCNINDNALIIAGSHLAGYVSIGNSSRVAPNAVIKQRIKVGDNAIVGIGAVVYKDVMDNESVMGNPARKVISPKN